MTDQDAEYRTLSEHIRDYINALEDPSADSETEYSPLKEGLYESIDDDIDIEEDLYHDLLEDLDKLTKQMRALTEGERGSDYQAGYEAAMFRAAELITEMLKNKYNASEE